MKKTDGERERFIKREGEGFRVEYKYDRRTEHIIRCIITVHRELGPGFLEGVYRKALLVELEDSGIPFETEKEIPLRYKNREVGTHRLDVLVADEIVVELKAVEELNRNHYAQIRSYLKATDLKVGLLVNFSKDLSDIRRVEQNRILNEWEAIC